MTPENFYITTPIFYPNGVPHIGHAYTMIATDVLARFQRLSGKRVLFLTGTDEHGQKMQRTAESQGLRAIELADQNSDIFRKLVEALECSHDDFIRTTEERHRVACQEIWRRMDANGDIYLDTYGGWYSVRQEAYFDEAETTVGDDGVRREPLGSEVEWVEEQSYFFKLSAYGDKLLEHYETNPHFIAPAERRNEVLSFVSGGLRDLSISRTTFDWGVPVPGNDEHVMYVWVDALTNYVTATDWPQGGPRGDFWPADLHVIGKDILRFHTVYWPAFLMSAGLPLPQRVFAHGFLFNKGEKMSKSVGNVLDPFAMAEEFGVDQMRFFFMREVPFGNDGSYSQRAIVERINADLANGLGNLAQRTLTQINKSCGGVVPEHHELLPVDRELLDTGYGLLHEVAPLMNRQQIDRAIKVVWSAVTDADRYIAAQQPWVLKKTDPQRMQTVLWTMAEVIRNIVILAQPVIPASCARLLDQLSVPPEKRSFAALTPEFELAPGTALPKPEGVFPRYVSPAGDA